MTDQICIAIDGPAGAGKSSVARIVAERLAYTYIDTGAMYRALAWKAMNQHIDLEDERAMKELLEDSRIDLMTSERDQRVFLDDKDITDEIRTTQVSNQVSTVARHKQVREELVNRQRELAANGGVVMDGRDIGTHVLPTADLKIFLTASVEIRAQRRHRENLQKGLTSDLGQMTTDIALRDRRDTQRDASPLMKAEDAVEIDTTEMPVEGVVSTILDHARERTK